MLSGGWLHADRIFPQEKQSSARRAGASLFRVPAPTLHYTPQSDRLAQNLPGLSSHQTNTDFRIRGERRSSFFQPTLHTAHTHFYLIWVPSFLLPFFFSRSISIAPNLSRFGPCQCKQKTPVFYLNHCLHICVCTPNLFISYIIVAARTHGLTKSIYVVIIVVCRSCLTVCLSYSP